MDRAQVKRWVYQYLVEEGHSLSAMAMAQELPDWSFHAASGNATGQLLRALDSYSELSREPAEADPVTVEKEALNTIQAEPFMIQEEVFMVSVCLPSKDWILIGESSCWRGLTMHERVLSVAFAVGCAHWQHH
jgi:hypothetical protein